MNRSLLLAAVTLLGVAFSADAAKKKPKKPVRVMVKEAPEGELFAVIATSAGEITARLYEKDAPKTVENFVGLATGKKDWKHPGSGQWQQGRPLYDKTAFHRVMPNFMIQGGDPFSSSVDGDPARAGSGFPGYRFGDEFGNGHKFDKGGYLAMANSGPSTNGSQFFITEVATMYLTDKHTIFGEVVQGQELVRKIADAGNMATKLEKITIVRGKLVPAK